MKKIYYLILITVVISSCKQECKEATNPPRTVSKTNESLYLPYVGNETLKFLKNGSDTIILNSQGKKTEYQYTSTQEDCPTKIPLENKYITFIDNANTIGFLIQLYITSTFSTYCIMKINNKVVYNDHIASLSGSSSTLQVLNVNYDEVHYIGDSNTVLYFQFTYKGIVKFKYYNDIYELIPN